MGKLLASFFLLSVLLWSCNSDYTPKPRGYYQIELPGKAYLPFTQAGYPYSFEYPAYGNIVQDSLFFEEKAENPYWINIDFPRFNGRVHLSYKDVGLNKFDSLVRDYYELSYKQHTIKASGIDHKDYRTPNGISGVITTLKGNAATTFQFYATDSTKHWLRGALYFSATPNADSIRPVNEFLRQDIEHLIETLRWK
jgi:gliding motility-associated lipoprotein GldD